ncbi:bacteriocin biosynthesis protein SagD [Halobacteriales archaeon QS_9_68_42]|nr:MAG: bacteriocin biosynthesis protein SagD [Halobacteriales archaeon QS_9_68_42]
MTTIGITGTGPAVENVIAAVEDTSADAVRLEAGDLAQADVAVDVRPVGKSAGADRPTGAETPLVVVELGGVGGRPVGGVNAAVSGHAPGTACYDCLRRRVEAVGAETGGADAESATARFAGAVAGRELATLVAGGESPLLGGVIEVPHASRRVLPVPYCDCAAGEDRDLRTDDGGRSLEAALASAETAFDERLGPIMEVGEAESFPAPYYLATLASAPFSAADPPDHAAGVGADWDPAFMKALGEALERYSAAVYRDSTFRSNPSAPVDPARFVAPGEPPAVGSVDAWHDARHLGTGETVQLPAEFVVFPPPERRIRPAITTGLGLGNSGVGALCSGLYEVIERDAAMLSWYSTYEPVALAVDDEAFEALAARAGSEGLSVTALSLTQDVDVPVVAVCVHREGEWPRFAAGSAASLDPRGAACNALEEAVQNWLELRRMGPDRAAEESGTIGRYAAFPEAARGFVTPATTVPAATIGPGSVPEGRAELDALLDRLEAAGLEAYGARLTPRDVESLGFEAVRAVVPGAQPLFTDEAYFGERARTVPETFGYEPQLDREHHPYP